ncbi:MAG TPA: 5-formyltetrahydrofolate cyclo-ligase [Steroidobacteraceae bacterium]|nr:5-formyltetrahydrofolate cyclo-ligase [Steroidobacteraceae bacterium]
MTTKQELRHSLKAQRRALTGGARVRAALDVARHISGTRWLAPRKRIGLYASLPHEMGTRPLIDLARERGCEIFLPRIVSTRAHRMEFVRIGDEWSARARMHALGMVEPRGTAFFPARFLDTIFVPAVGLDLRGARLGHGAGFYDRALAFRRMRTQWRGPRLVGLAYSFQVVPRIPVDGTDVSMDMVVTERGIHELLADED